MAAVSTAIVVSQFSSRSEDAFRVHAEQLAVQSATLAATDVAAADRAGTLQGRLATIAQHFDLDLYVLRRRRAGAREGARADELRARTGGARGCAARGERGPEPRTDHARRRPCHRRRAAAHVAAHVDRCGEPASRCRGGDRDPERPGAARRRNRGTDRRARRLDLRAADRAAAAPADVRRGGDRGRRLRALRGALPVPRRVRRARAELRPDAAAAATLVPAHRGRARPAAPAARAAARGRRHGRPRSRRAVRERRGAARARDATRRRRPASRAVDDVLVARIRSQPLRSGIVVARAGARPARRRARARARRDPGAARERVGDDRPRRPDRAGAARARRAGVRLERRARATDAVDDDHRRDRGAAGRREGEPARARPLPHAHRTRGRAARPARTRAADARARTRRTGAPAARRRAARRALAGARRGNAHGRRCHRRGRMPAGARREREPRPARAGAAEPRRQRGEAHARAVGSSSARTLPVLP